MTKRRDGDRLLVPETVVYVVSRCAVTAAAFFLFYWLIGLVSGR